MEEDARESVVTLIETGISEFDLRVKDVNSKGEIVNYDIEISPSTWGVADYQVSITSSDYDVGDSIILKMDNVNKEVLLGILRNL
jgi:hypothetical protein